MGTITTKDEIIKKYDSLDKEERELNIKLRKVQVKLNAILPENKRVMVKDNLNESDPPEDIQTENINDVLDLKIIEEEVKDIYEMSDYEEKEDDEDELENIKLPATLAISLKKPKKSKQLNQNSQHNQQKQKPNNKKKKKKKKTIKHSAAIGIGIELEGKANEEEIKLIEDLKSSSQKETRIKKKSVPKEENTQSKCKKEAKKQ